MQNLEVSSLFRAGSGSGGALGKTRGRIDWLKKGVVFGEKGLVFANKGGWRETIEGRGEGNKFLTTIPRKSTAGQAVTKEHEGI